MYRLIAAPARPRHWGFACLRCPALPPGSGARQCPRVALTRRKRTANSTLPAFQSLRGKSGKKPCSVLAVSVSRLLSRVTVTELQEQPRNTLCDPRPCLSALPWAGFPPRTFAFGIGRWRQEHAVPSLPGLSRGRSLSPRPACPGPGAPRRQREGAAAGAPPGRVPGLTGREDGHHIRMAVTSGWPRGGSPGKHKY